MKTFFVVLALLSLGCTRPAPTVEPGSSCVLDDGKVLDVTGRADGIYGVRGEQVDAEALVPWKELTLEESGVDASNGKPWLHLTVSDHGAKRLAEFTSTQKDRSIATVFGGALVSHHKIRAALTGPKLQISCCDPRACERLIKRL
jgi:preprotein translocase subunit SecD